MAIHVGRGTSRAGLTIFPLWHDGAAAREFTTSPASLTAAELPDGPDVGALMVLNHGPVPVLIPDGQLFDAGWQHRMALGSSLIEPGLETTIRVACVEQNRWGGGTTQRAVTRRASPFVREGGRHHQGEVWSRVSRHTHGHENATSSLVRRMDQQPASLTGLRPLPGQSGVLLGLGGQPYVAEVFDSPERLAQQWTAILEAAQLDAALVPPEATPSRRARRFIERLESLTPVFTQPAGLGRGLEGASHHVRASYLRWGTTDVHTRATNLQHQLWLAA